MKNLTKLSVVFLVIGSVAGLVWANGAVDGDEPAMMVSPSVIVLAKVDTVTVHTNIFLAAVDRETIRLNGVEPTGVGIDSRGHLVAKFAVADLDLEPGERILTLSGDFKEGGNFSVSDTVTVK
jgi:hypothetical protein